MEMSTSTLLRVSSAVMPGAPEFDPIAEAHRQWVGRDLPEPEAMRAATALTRAQQLVNGAIERTLRPLGLTFARYEVLMLLSFSRHGALPITKMGGRLMVHPTGITKLVDKLEQQGLVERVPNPNDRRGTLARITPAGRRTAKKATTALGDVSFGLDLTGLQLARIVDAVSDVRRQHGDV
jgi:DNA-binding MarR family transcriptional regulator